jgi:hypothetical protein
VSKAAEGKQKGGNFIHSYRGKLQMTVKTRVNNIGSGVSDAILQSVTYYNMFISECSCE